MAAYRIDLSYDGSGFHGYARQRDVRTVQGELEAALARVLGPTPTVVAGRTDAGVHARQQVVSFVTDTAVDCDRLARSLTGLLGPDIAVFNCERVADGFSARFSAVRRTYRYHILNRPYPDPLRRAVVWHVKHPLEVTAMNRAAGHLVGEHDFASFCRRAEGRSTVRTVLAAAWTRAPEDLVRLEIAGSAFCHQMVRSIVAFCVEVGRGRLAPEDTPRVVEARDRGAARGAAPPQGLVLWSVDY
ncbi:MAG: tRNA pseudouridine(38-40) synthase TruA [bacterium]|nr:tRNA pseudouridine(38-40) synthase TruA [bacterium]MDE0439009.1 tRNA pseudouridine(38-40) synthase TruA [bacterium]